MSKKKIIIIGGIPQPVGGVTGFIYRLCRHLPDHIDSVIDLYPNPQKWSLGDVRLIDRKKGLSNTIWWLMSSTFALLHAHKVYFNFSGTKFLKLAVFIPKMPWQSWIMTLHHGDLQSTEGLAFFERVGLSRMNKIGYIGQKQSTFYQSNNFAPNQLFPIVPFLPYVPPPKETISFDQSFTSILNEIRKKHSKILLASGYPSLIYNHEWILEYMQQSDNKDIAIILCLYGDDSENRREGLKKTASQNSQIYLYEYLQPDAFQQVLRITDIYLRPNEVDSYGVAVGEAISLGKVAIASDACDRFKGARIFSVGDKERFYELIDEAITETPLKQQDVENSSLEMCQKLLY